MELVYIVQSGMKSNLMGLEDAILLMVLLRLNSGLGDSNNILLISIKLLAI